MTILSCEEQAKLAMAICATAEAVGHTISATAAEVMASDLASYPAETISAALRACRFELKGNNRKLTLSEIVDRIHARDGRPGEEEAWAIALLAFDESATVLMTDEIHAALAVARPVMELGDKVGARMAFKDAYNRAMAAARRDLVPARWTPSFGSDPAGRLLALQEGVRLGRLPAAEAEEYVETLALTHQPIAADGLAIAGLLTGNPDAPPPSQELRGRWRDLAEQVRRNAEEGKARREHAREQERAKLEARKAEALSVLTHLQSRPSSSPELTDG